MDTTTDDALGTGDATDLVAALTSGAVSPAEVRAAATARARAANSRINAVTRWFPGAIAAAAPAAGDAPLSGIPTFVKDNEEVVGHPTSQGSWAVVDRRAQQCSPIVTALLDAGLVPLGASTLPEFGLTASTESSRFGATANPWDTDRSAGGSSGGAAAMVAAGVVPMAHGNDGGGSLRIPAAACGIVGLKPSRGRLPMNPLKQKVPVLIAVQGVLTRTVRDTALFYGAMDQLRPAEGLPPIGHVTRPGSRRLRIGLCRTATRGLPIHPETRDAIVRAGELCESLGHHVDLVGPPVGDGFAPDFVRYWALLALFLRRAGAMAYGSGFDAARLEKLTVGLSARATKQIDRMPGTIRRLRRAAARPTPIFDRYDLLISPVTGHAAPPLGHLGPDVDFHTHLVRLVRFAPMTAAQNVSGEPAISLPLGRTRAGLPIGVQVAAPLGMERRLLQIALELEEAAPWPGRPGAAAPPT